MYHGSLHGPRPVASIANEAGVGVATGGLGTTRVGGRVPAGTAIVGVTGAGLAPHAVTTIATTRAKSADAADPLTRTGSASDVSGVTSLGTPGLHCVAVRIFPPRSVGSGDIVGD